ncbi:MAG: hypothetical protein IPP42_17420 [Saprospiraceae bacterium]|nr:hypothetical protein [Saprospiraceae bacterium]
MEDDKIVNGFNSGYEIARQDLVLAKTLSESYKGEKTDYVVAFEKGIQEYELKEKVKEKLPLQKTKPDKQKDDREFGL